MERILKVLSALASSVFLFACTTSLSEKETNLNPSEILPAFEHLNVEYAEYELNANRGDTLFTGSGTILVFPQNAFLHSSGKIVDGKVKVVYREFRDPLDFFLSGIPMNYDSAGNSYDFESIGMMEVQAFDGENRLFVNPDNKPSIYYSSNSSDTRFNLYSYSEETQEWLNQGKDSIINPNMSASLDTSYFLQDTHSMVKPVMPQRADVNKPSITIIIEPGSVKELEAYHNLRFEIDDSDTSYDARDAEISWTDVQIERGEREGQYIVSFSNPQKTVSYVTRPILAGKDYDNALEVFRRKKIEYERLRASRLEYEKDLRARQEKQLQRNQEIRELNELIAKRNAEVEAINQQKREEYQKKLKDYQEQLEESQRRREEYQKQREKYMEQLARDEKKREMKAYNKGGSSMQSEVLRFFRLEGFGIWNLDVPLNQNGFLIAADFIDNNGKDLNLPIVYAVYKDFNGIRKYNSGNLKVLADQPMMIWAVQGKRFVYLDYMAYSDYSIDSTIEAFTFSMMVSENEIQSSDDIRALLGPL